MFIDGQWTDGARRDVFESDDPYRGKPWALIPRGTADDVDRAVRAAHRALTTGEWPKLTASKRGALLRRFGDLITERSAHLAAIEVRDNGKLYAEMSAQCAYMAQWYHYYGGLADKVEGAVLPTDKPDTFNFTRYEPLGVIAAIVPWNSPLLLTTWKLAPALAAGCTVVTKPSDHTPVTALELAELVTEAGFPAGVFNVVTGDGPDVGRALVRHPGVDKVAFTGSTKTGVDVAAGATSHLARVTLELGGKSAQVVFADADLEAAANGVIAGVFAATGQTCMAGSRLVVHEDVHDELVERIAERARTIVLGNPVDPDTEMGPLANAAQFEKVTGILDAAKREGATLSLIHI